MTDSAKLKEQIDTLFSTLAKRLALLEAVLLEGRQRQQELAQSPDAEAMLAAAAEFGQAAETVRNTTTLVKQAGEALGGLLVSGAMAEGAPADQQQLDEMLELVHDAEDVRKRFEQVVTATTTGIVVLDRQGQIAVLLNAECAPFMQIGGPLPPELLQALNAYDGVGALDCDTFEIVEVAKGRQGEILGFAFFAKEAVQLATQTTEALISEALDDDTGNLADILDELENKKLDA